MAVREPQWGELRTFLEVVRDSSLSGAARRLGIAQPTVGRHIYGLEAALVVALFARSPRGLTPTATARSLSPHVEAMAAAAAALGRTAAGEGSADQGIVRVTASETTGCEVLPAIFAAFHAQHPGIAIELALSNRNQDLSRRDADIAVRMVRPTQSALVARRIGSTRIGLFAHRDYLAGRAFLARRTCGDRDDRSFRAAGPLAARLSPDTFGFRCDSDAAQLAALRAGVGIGGCQKNIARRSPELSRILPNLSHPLEIWLVMHEDMKGTPRLRLLFDHLAAGLVGYVRGAVSGR